MRFPYQNGDLKARGPAEHIADVPGGRGHSTRDIQFSLDGKKMFVSVGSGSNVDDPDVTPAEKNRADVLEFNPDGSGMRIYAYGIRNCVGLAINPKTGELWCSVNERDALGRQPGSGLHHARAGRRLLRLAVVVHGRPSGPPARRQASGAEGQSHHPGRPSEPAQRVAGITFLRRQTIPRGISGRHFRLRTRLVEPRGPRGL